VSQGYYIPRGALTQKAAIDIRFEFRIWSGARDLNPGPHGPELCDISFRNGANDRCLFEIL
jgi:hypothetical protein